MSKVDLQHYGRPAPRGIGRESLGTWLDGAYGWHNTYRVVDAAVARGFKLGEDDAEIVERYRRDEQDYDSSDPEAMQEVSTEATDYLQSLVTDDNLAFVWDAGELSLQEVDEEGEPVL